MMLTEREERRKRRGGKRMNTMSGPHSSERREDASRSLSRSSHLEEAAYDREN